MPSIEIDSSLFAFLQKKAIPFVDTPNTVLRRLLKIDDATKLGAKPNEDVPLQNCQEAHEDEVSAFVSELDRELTNSHQKKKTRTKQPKTNLEILIQTGVLRQGETVYLVDYQGTRIPGVEAKVRNNLLERGGQAYSMSDLARTFLNKVGFTSTSVRGPAHWANEKGQTLALLWDDYLSKQ